MSLTYDELKEAMKEREDVDTLVDFFQIDIDEFVESNLLDEKICDYWDILQEIYANGGSL
jgi:hypothetical protein